MALLDEMRTLVGDLEAAFSRRLENENERQETAARDNRERAGADRKRKADAAQDARERAGEVRERRAAAEQGARERLAEISVRYNEVADTVEEFRRERLAQTADNARDRTRNERKRRADAAEDARERAGDDRERRSTAAHEAHERVAEILGLGNIWGVHTATIAGLGGGGFRITARTPARPESGEEPGLAPAAAKAPSPAKAAKPARAAKKPARAARAKPARAAKPARGKPASVTAISSYLADHPDGVKMAELQGEFSSSRSVLSRILKEMIADHTARQEQKSRLYFAA